MNHYTPAKRCSKCGHEFPQTPAYFSRSQKSKDGLKSRCKPCQREDYLIYRQNNLEKELARHKRYRDENPDTVRAINKAYRDSHKQERLEYDREWRKRNPDKVHATQKRSYLKCAEKKRAYHRNWTRLNLDHVRSYNNEYRQNNLDKVRARERIYARTEAAKLRRYRKRTIAANLPSVLTDEQWNFALDYWGHCCAVCGRSQGLWHIVVGDHWTPVIRGGGTIPTNMLPLCHALKDGTGGCNNTKTDLDPELWLERRLGKRKAKKKLAEINAYFQVIRDHEDSNG